MLSEISIRQLQEWRAYADLEPFDEERADIRAGTIVQAIRNTNRVRGQAPVKLTDCLLRFVEDEAPQTEDTRARAMAEVKAAMGMMVAQQRKAKRKAKAKA